jgi:hypothetical protein
MRTQHHSVLAEGNRLPVSVGRDVLDGQRAHRNPRIEDSWHAKRHAIFAPATVLNNYDPRL